MRHRKPRRVRRQGRHLLLLGSASLFALSAWELWVRFEDFWAWTSGIRHLSQVRKTPFLEDLGIVFEAPEMQSLGLKMLFLVCSLAFAVICLVRRNRARGAWLLLALDAAVVGVGAWLGLYSLRVSDWSVAIKLMPMALIAIGCVLNRISLALDGPDPRRRRPSGGKPRGKGERPQASAANRPRRNDGPPPIRPPMTDKPRKEGAAAGDNLSGDDGHPAASEAAAKASAPAAPRSWQGKPAARRKRDAS